MREGRDIFQLLSNLHNQHRTMRITDHIMDMDSIIYFMRTEPEYFTPLIALALNRDMTLVICGSDLSRLILSFSSFSMQCDKMFFLSLPPQTKCKVVGEI